MRILVDADACPVKDIIIKIAKEYGTAVIMFADTSHILNYDCEIVTVDKGSNSADMVLTGRVEKNDIVVTQDYGVATMALLKKAHTLNQNGLIFNEHNIDKLLFERYLSQRVRRSGGKTSNQSKRKKLDDDNFEASLRKLCQLALNG